MAKLRRAITIALLAVSSPWLYDRYLAFSGILAQRPGKLMEVNMLKSLEVKFQDKIRNCEDVILVEEKGVALLSCDPGRDRWNTVMGTFTDDNRTGESSGIWIYDYATTDALTSLDISSWASHTDFHPLGLELDASTSTLYIVNHARSGSAIEIFTIDWDTSAATHVKTFKHPLLHAPNALEILGEGTGKIYVSNDHAIRAAVSPLLSQIETFSGAPGGSVVYIDINAPETAKVVARVPFANGVKTLNSTHLAVASSAKAGVYFYTINPDYTLTFTNLVRTPSTADNLSVDSNGKLLIAGHPFAPALMEVAKGRAGCDPNGTAEEKKACGCEAPSWVGEWSEDEGLKTLLVSKGQDEEGKGICASSTAVRDVQRGVGLVSMLYGRGVGVFKV
ncbi:hypothetical protein BKA63DRAFT_601239 [Paraphoma chrysanthemicola]|nr:hypothetical protein BKA63DRAFT_601239 [Paraphoma chrysanthemicola]